MVVPTSPPVPCSACRFENPAGARFLEEITRSFLDNGILVPRDGGYALARPVTPQDLPDSVQGVIMARIGRGGRGRRGSLSGPAPITPTGRTT